MSFDEKLYKKKVENLTQKEVEECYFGTLNISKGLSRGENISVYTTEMQRRSNKKTNRIMIICTVAITVMTALILWATLVGANIISYGG